MHKTSSASVPLTASSISSAHHYEIIFLEDNVKTFQ